MQRPSARVSALADYAVHEDGGPELRTRDDEEKTGEGEKETRVFRSGRRLLERGASIFRGGLDDKNCDFDDDDDDGRAALGVVR